ncbi:MULTISPECIES: hypothetical protein [Bradyrhizobium]|uniref:hypothetical protein n=1 Tax=Bradyrhizobium TaxID=374 RepID=UPI001FEE72AA|nr:MULTISPECIES: hypothetical protein [Bradyrhizobium]
MIKPAEAQATGYNDTAPWPGVVVREYEGETPSLIPRFKTVSMRDVIMQPESKTMGPPMMNAMICHITEGELRLEQGRKTFTGKKDFVWTCNKETKEQAYNDGNVVAIMRITDPEGLRLFSSQQIDCRSGWRTRRHAIRVQDRFGSEGDIPEVGSGFRFVPESGRSGF